MSEAARQNAFWSYKPGHKLTPEESDAFDYGWRAAMRFMAQPRIPALDVSEPVKAGEHRERSAGKMPVCPNCGSNTQVWRTNTLTATGVFWCHRLGCECVVPGPDTTLTSTPVHKEPDQKHGIEKPPKPCLHPTDPLQRQYYVPTPAINWSEEEKAILRRAALEASVAAWEPPKEHSPHGLVAFYTDAPVCAMCGGRGVIGSVSREDPGGNQEPCPECNPEGLPRGCNV